LGREVKRTLDRHSLTTFARCPRKWHYRYNLGLVPKNEPAYITLGNLVHEGFAHGYSAAKLTVPQHLGNGPSFVYNSAYEAIWASNIGTVEQRALAADLLLYWNDHNTQRWSDILSVEHTYFTKLVTGAGPSESGDGITTKSGHSTTEQRVVEQSTWAVPATPDLVARDLDGIIVIVDHKTKGSIKDSLGFMPIDPQLRRYAAAIYAEYGEIPEVQFNILRSTLPPDFERRDGTRPYALTKTGRDSTRTTKVDDYLATPRLVFTKKQIEATNRELQDELADLEQANETQRFTRRIISGGIWGCEGCPYFGPCAREFDGNKLDPLSLKLAYTIETPVSDGNLTVKLT
jgi:hypothetical protein